MNNYRIENGGAQHLNQMTAKSSVEESQPIPSFLPMFEVSNNSTPQNILQNILYTDQSHNQTSSLFEMNSSNISIVDPFHVQIPSNQCHALFDQSKLKMDANISFPIVNQCQGSNQGIPQEVTTNGKCLLIDQEENDSKPKAK